MTELRTFLYTLARLLGDLDAILHPKKLLRRYKNKWIGRAVGKRLFK